MEKTDSSIGDRFRAVFDALGVNANEVAIKLGENSAKFYNILNGKAAPSYATIQQIINTYSRINGNYLLKGQLPILHTSNAQIVSVVDSGPNIVSLPLLVPTTNYIENMNELSTYPVLVYDTTKSYSDCVVVKLTDSSMAPRYTSGMRLLARPVQTDDWGYLSGCLVLALYRSTLAVRRIKENELPVKNFLTLYADSVDGGFVIVKRDDLRSIWQIVDIVGVESLP